MPWLGLNSVADLLRHNEDAKQNSKKSEGGDDQNEEVQDPEGRWLGQERSLTERKSK
jgi:hypothetical protein